MKEIPPFAAVWLNLEDVMPSELCWPGKTRPHGRTSVWSLRRSDSETGKNGVFKALSEGSGEWGGFGWEAVKF
jgi:hypothetical protein